MSEIVKPEEVEKKLVEQSNKPLDGIEAAATMFGLYKDKFSQFITELSTGELRRLLNALVQYPLQDNIFIEDTSSAKLKESFALGQGLLEAKFVMIFDTFMKNQQGDQGTAETNKENPETKQGEKTNG